MHPIIEFAKKVEQRLPHDWNVDELHARKTDGRQIGLRRDDHLAIILEVPHNEEWEPQEIGIHIPKTVGGIPDRPNQPFHHVPCTVRYVVNCVNDNAPEYNN